MKKELILLFFVLILSLSLASAGWFSDIFGRITGDVSFREGIERFLERGTGVPQTNPITFPETTTANPPQTCTETDGQPPQNPNVKESCTNSFGETTYDNCVIMNGVSKLSQGSCDANKQCVYSEGEDCPSGEECRDGACVFPDTCTQENEGEFECLSQTLYHVCALREGNYEWVQDDCSEGYKCDDESDSCIPIEERECTETDGQPPQNPNVKESCTNYIGESAPDVCVDENGNPVSPETFSDYVAQWKCDAQKFYCIRNNPQKEKCAEGYICKNGECIQKQSCGIVYYQADGDFSEIFIFLEHGIKVLTKIKGVKFERIQQIPIEDVRTPFSLPSSISPDCSELYIQYEMHGNYVLSSCNPIQNAGDIVEACIKTAGTCPKIIADSAGCQSFNNVKSSQDFLIEMGKNILADFPEKGDCTVDFTIKGNQGVTILLPISDEASAPERLYTCIFHPFINPIYRTSRLLSAQAAGAQKITAHLTIDFVNKGMKLTTKYPDCSDLIGNECDVFDLSIFFKCLENGKIKELSCCKEGSDYKINSKKYCRNYDDPTGEKCLILNDKLSYYSKTISHFCTRADVNSRRMWQKPPISNAKNPVKRPKSVCGRKVNANKCPQYLTNKKGEKFQLVFKNAGEGETSEDYFIRWLGENPEKDLDYFLENEPVKYILA